MSSHLIPDVSRLIVLTHGSERGRVIALTKPRLSVGRGEGCDIRLSDSGISRLHADLHFTDGRLFVDDYNSLSGTFVNGARVSSTQEVRAGDVLSFASTQVQYAPARIPNAAPPAMPLGPGPVFANQGAQHADVINQVGGNQYHSYVQHRESFLREVAAAKTRARWLIWLGLAFLAIGVVLFGSEILSSFESAGPGTPIEDRGFSAIAIVGWAMAAGGQLMVIVGIVLHVVAAARRRRVETQNPVRPSGRRPF